MTDPPLNTKTNKKVIEQHAVESAHTYTIKRHTMHPNPKRTDTHTHTNTNTHDLAKYSSVVWTSLCPLLLNSSFHSQLVASLFKNKTNVDNRRDAKWLPLRRQLWHQVKAKDWYQRVLLTAPPLPLQSAADESKAGSTSFKCLNIYFLLKFRQTAPSIVLLLWSDTRGRQRQTQPDDSTLRFKITPDDTLASHEHKNAYSCPSAHSLLLIVTPSSPPTRPPPLVSQVSKAPVAGQELKTDPKAQPPSQPKPCRGRCWCLPPPSLCTCVRWATRSAPWSSSSVAETCSSGSPPAPSAAERCWASSSSSWFGWWPPELEKTANVMYAFRSCITPLATRCRENPSGPCECCIFEPEFGVFWAERFPRSPPLSFAQWSAAVDQSDWSSLASGLWSSCWEKQKQKAETRTQTINNQSFLVRHQHAQTRACSLLIWEHAYLLFLNVNTRSKTILCLGTKSNLLRILKKHIFLFLETHEGTYMRENSWLT